jgi:hypothetical protein
MTLTILDPRSGETVTIYIENVAAVRQPVVAKVVAIRASEGRISQTKIHRSSLPRHTGRIAPQLGATSR